jgi:hypothetical protein
MIFFILTLFACSDQTHQTDSNEFVNAETLGFQSATECMDCHPRQYDEWRQSMHAYAARSPYFDAMVAKAYRDSAGEIGTFCVQCHSPYGDMEGDPGYSTAATRSDLALEGISCDVCHTAVGHGRIGNGDLIQDTTAGKQGPYVAAEFEGHATEASNFIQSPALCGTCHDVFKFPGLQLEEAYSEYLESPAAERGATCQDCHMSSIPGVEVEREMGPSAVSLDGEVYPDREITSHRFVGPDYSILDDFPYPDDLEASAAAQEEYLGLVQILLENAVEIRDVTSSILNSTINVDVSLASLTDGHQVPTGFTAERQLWVEVIASNDLGELVFSSGDLDSYGDLRNYLSQDVQQGLVDLDSQLVNLQGEPVTIEREFTDNGQYHDDESGSIDFISEAVFPWEGNHIERHGLKPLELRTFYYSFDCGNCSRVDVTLYYRNLPPYVVRAMGAHELVEKLKIFSLDSWSIDL